jgi:phenylpropionate dioxygenase-like ring-hydroxylating dioxygenase large terminal subunit
MDNPSAVCPDPVRETTGWMGAGRNWPLNSWWVAAHASEVSHKPTLRWVLETPMVLYRKADGEAVTLHNRCAHRWAPLSMGEVQGDNLVCAYHGLQYAPSGQCVKVPTQENTPPAIRVRSFPTSERYGFVWVWTGNPTHADPELIPADLAYLMDPTWHSVWGYRAVNANYMQIKENVLDLTHFSFLHKNSLGISDWNCPAAVEVTDSRVIFRQSFPMAPLAPIYAIPAGKPVGKPVSRENWGAQLSPGAHHGSVEMHDPYPEPSGLEHFKLRVIHLTTPVSVGKTHYYWAMARDHGEPFEVEKTRAAIGVIFDEDIVVLEATHAMVQRSCDQDEAVELSIKADRAGIEGRRKVAAMVKAE